HPTWIQSQILGPLAAIDLEFELSRRVSVGVDGEQAIHVHRHVQQPGWRVASLRAGIDLYCHIEGAAGLEDDLGVEDRFRPGAPLSLDQAAGAVTKDVGSRIGYPTDHPMRHRLRVRAELGVDARDDYLQLGQQTILLIKTSVLQ